MSGFCEVQRVSGAVVRSSNLIFFFLANVPIALNWTRPPVGTEDGTDVLVDAGRGVSVGVGVRFVGEGVGLALEVGTNVGVGAGPSEMVKTLSGSPGFGVGVATADPLPPEQLRKIAPKTNNTTGEITSHLSHRDINIKP